MRHKPHATWRTLNAAILLTAMAGCIVVPIPVHQTAGTYPASRSAVADAPPAMLAVGEEARIEVLMELGEPDGRAVDDSWFTYETVVQRGGVRWLAAMVVSAGYSGGSASASPMGDWDTSRRLVIRFTADGIVSAATVDQRRCTAWGGVSTEGSWAGDCLDARGGDLAAEDEQRRGDALIAGAGAVAARYPQYSIQIGEQANCAYPGVTGGRTEFGHVFIVGENALVWQNEFTQHWDSLRVADIVEVEPVEMHFLLRWMIPIQRKDGPCLFLVVSTKKDIEQSESKKVQEQARSVIAARLANRAP
jgi:hypothetical protein